MAYDLQLFTNNAVTLLASPISAVSTSLAVMTGYGQLFPNPGPGEFFLVTLENQSGTVREIIRVTGRTGDSFTGLIRAQEGTIAQAWSASLGSDTLVDHRVTAETMRLAMVLPESIPGPKGDTGDVGPKGDTGLTGDKGDIGDQGLQGLKGDTGDKGDKGDKGDQGDPGVGSSISVQEEGVTVGVPATELNFVGPLVTVTGAAGTKTITITGSVPAEEIHGATTLVPVDIDPAWTQPLSTVTYSQYQRGFKFFVTIFMPANDLSCTFEVLGNIGGNLAANAETVTWNRTARVGFNFAGTLNITLNSTTKALDLTWTNAEANPVEVLCTRIQHLP